MPTDISPSSTVSRSELRELVQRQLELLLEQKNYEGAKALLIPVQPVDIAEAIENLPETMQVIGFRLLNQTTAITVYEYLEPKVQVALLEHFKEQEVISIVENMSTDERAKLFEELPAKIVRQLINHLSLEERQATSLLLGYQPNTAGRLMTPDYIALKQNLTIIEAEERIRRLAQDVEVSYYLYVTDEQKRLVGIVSLKDLLLAKPEQIIEEIMTRDIVYSYTNCDREEVAQLIQRYDLLALPIVDQEQHLLGVVTVDDVLDILEAEATEDIYLMGALQDDGDDYFQANLFDVVKKRIPWLSILLLTNSATIFIMSGFEEVIEQVVALSFFTPLLIDAGGNVGAQSSTVVIRGLSTKSLQGKKTTWVILRELIAGGLLGLIMGIVVIVGVFFILGKPDIGLTVGLSLLVITILAATTGAGLPFLFKSLGFDPALMSAPFITTVVDILGLFIYFSIAQAIVMNGA
ncbi:magnesium transporter [Spirulina subsalsa FACHB-351]|uniref:Magnesium transporter MgtE n=1 Tax=Spirulina subsalsa FACHB-351 TaxID=234711 RepID=A0ABT3L1H0_9CYAN|nr:magnesium transporter [Spirulina subsalsa]MCW6035344.1 magnesium transporter [Spirulina subsalsa FACHB-351]